ncbi:MAG: hypothetical protein JW836_11500 [Deltaproteobacteria bacterium]|nr:hypothetical protein [Deltaproteobacteria bacterium]
MTVIIASTPAPIKTAGHPERLEAIFHTVDTIKSDLNKCGMRLQVCREFSGITPFMSTPSGFTCLYGLADELLLEKAVSGQQTLKVAANEFFKKDKPVLIYDPIQHAWETNEIESRQDGAPALKAQLQNDYLTDSMVVVLKKVEYKFCSAQRVLKRKVDNGSFQPLLEDVSDFHVTFFPDANSVLYRIEVNKKEQIRGYIFLLNLV